MDTFTKNILSRARERQQMLENYTLNKDIPLSKCNQDKPFDSPLVLPTRVSSDFSVSPKSQVKTLNIQQENFNMEIKLTSTDNVRVDVEIAEGTDKENNQQDSGLRVESKKKLKQLGKLYSGGDEVISSPIHKTETKFYDDENVVATESKSNIPKSRKKGLSKLAHLAETINQWEDDTHRSCEVNKKPELQEFNTPPVSQPNISQKLITSKGVPCQSESNPKHDSSVNHFDSPTKKAVPTVASVIKKFDWDKNVLDTLESQGFTRTNSNSRLIYSYRQQNPEIKMALKTVVNKEKPNAVAEVEEGQSNCLSEVKAKPTINIKETNKYIAPCLETIPEQKVKPIQNISTKISTKSPNITDKITIFEGSPSKNTKDPALLSVSERKALFEKNIGEILLPKAAFGMAPPVIETTKASSTKIVSDKIVKPKFPITKQLQTVEPIVHLPTTNAVPQLKHSNDESLQIVTSMVQSPKKLLFQPNTELNSTTAVVHQGSGIAKTMAALLESKSTISQSQIENSIKSQRQKEMDMLLNRFNKNKETLQVTDENIKSEDEDDEIDTFEETPILVEKSPRVIQNREHLRKSAEKRKSGSRICSKEDSPRVAAVLDEVKRIKVSPPKAGRLYPNLSDIEATTETDTDYQTRTPTPETHNSYEDNNCDSDDANTSFGRDILQAVCSKSLTPHKRPIYDESTASDVSSILEESSSLEDLSNEDNTTAGPTPPKQACQNAQKQCDMQTSSSFSYKSFSTPISSPANIRRSPKKSKDVPEYVVEGDDVLPLTYTVSFYRKQQNESQTPIRQISRVPLTEELMEENVKESESVANKIKELQEEVHKHQNIISQTSQALNLCSATPEFSGSTEQVEAEKLLLVASHRRQAALHELQRLKVEKTVRPQGQFDKKLQLKKGTLTISNIVLPLKHKYVKALAAAGGKGHHVVCLIKCGEQVIPTKLVSTAVPNITNPPTDLTIPGTVTLKNVYSDFTVTFEVYCLQAQEEFLPHEVKYHITSKKGGSKSTPKKSKQDSRMIMPIKESPGGPQAVRTSSFAVMGYVIFSIQAMNKRVFTLNNTPPMSPLEGSVEMRISGEMALLVEYRGFLTMFDDVSGFGAWHRRWCLLKGHTLNYWKYPDDEKKMAPINTIDLSKCITTNVGPVSREICARLHTLLIETERMARPQDKDSLVTVCKGDRTIIRHLLSADTKEERIEWCAKFNAALAGIRMWRNS